MIAKIVGRLVLLSMSFALAVFVFSGYSECAPPLSEDAALNALKSVSPDVKVVAVEPTMFEGIWEVTVIVGGNVGIVYMDPSARYVFSGSILDVDTKSNITRDRIIEANQKYEKLTRVDLALIPLDDALVLGNKAAAKKVIVFDDPD